MYAYLQFILNYVYVYFNRRVMFLNYLLSDKKAFIEICTLFILQLSACRFAGIIFGWRIMTLGHFLMSTIPISSFTQRRTLRPTALNIAFLIEWFRGSGLGVRSGFLNNLLYLSVYHTFQQLVLLQQCVPAAFHPWVILLVMPEGLKLLAHP